LPAPRMDVPRGRVPHRPTNLLLAPTTAPKSNNRSRRRTILKRLRLLLPWRSLPSSERVGAGLIPIGIHHRLAVSARRSLDRPRRFNRRPEAKRSIIRAPSKRRVAALSGPIRSRRLARRFTSSHLGSGLCHGRISARRLPYRPRISSRSAYQLLARVFRVRAKPCPPYVCRTSSPIWRRDEKKSPTPCGSRIDSNLACPCFMRWPSPPTIASVSRHAAGQRTDLRAGTSISVCNQIITSCRTLKSGALKLIP